LGIIAPLAYKLICPFLRGIGGAVYLARISNSQKEEMIFWINSEGNIQYHPKCERCKHECKQSFRCKEVICPRYERR